MAQWIKCLMYKCEDLSLDDQGLPNSRVCKSWPWQHVSIALALGVGVRLLAKMLGSRFPKRYFLKR